MMMSTRCATALAAAPVLFSLQACGDGRPVETDMPVMSSTEIKAEIAAIYHRSNTLIEEVGRNRLFGPQRYARPILIPEGHWFSLESENLRGNMNFIGSESWVSLVRLQSGPQRKGRDGRAFI